MNSVFTQIIYSYLDCGSAGVNFNLTQKKGSEHNSESSLVVSIEEGFN